MTQTQLNLSRKWRSKQFDSVIGQELSLRVLQNSLYANQLFPVYLFSGQRGCGKTTTARIFAAALNCKMLGQFQKNPKEQKIPCFVCDSCVAMATGGHPDFIEIDAASHTGVDNVRSIIESASLLPVLGQKKVYLIDEAHMLSKAAFNAFLKILEEPPASVLFILATTDPHKIIETVRSRCFQLFFTAVAIDTMIHHLAFVCQQERIEFEESALYAIATETEGSVRDALNLLEQVRFSHTKVTSKSVFTMLGHMPESLLINVFEAIVVGNLKQLLNHINTSSFEQYVPLAVWNKSTDFVRMLLFLKQGIVPTIIFEDSERVRLYSERLSIARIITFLQILYRYEFLILKSTAAHKVLEMMFLELCQVGEKSEKINSNQVVEQVQKSSFCEVQLESIKVANDDTRWKNFVSEIEKLSDPLLQSIFKQAQCTVSEQTGKNVKVHFLKEATFFKDWLQDTKSIWQPLLENFFGEGAQLESLFDKVKDEKKREFERETVVAQKYDVVKKTMVAHKVEIDKNKEKIIDISDTQKWHKAHLLKEAFGGFVVDVQEEEIDDKIGQ